MKTSAKTYSKKLKGSIVLTLTIFILAIMVFSICAIDAGYVVTSRYKTQKITETLALYMVSTLNSLPEEKRNEESLEDIKETFENLYSSNKLSGFYGFKITDIQIKDKNLNPKIKVSTETYIPTLFLRYAGIGLIRIYQTSYATSEEINIPEDNTLSTDKYYTFKAKTPITDKFGSDIKVDYTGDYFIFAGITGSDGLIYWTELGSNASKEKTEYTLTDKITNEKFQAFCVNDSDTFDFNSDPLKTIGLVKYIRIYKANCLEETSPEDIPILVEDTDKPVVTILNSVKLIKKSNF